MQELNAIILIAYLFKISSCESIVETNSGYVKSVAAQLDDVEAFLGIPYAEPPIGDLRFAKPVPKQPWTKIFDASSLPPPCVQQPLYLDYAFFPDTTNMSEDCLYLNIWKPKAKPSAFLRPVIIYIHYGGFVVGSSNKKELDGSRLASQGDVVVVTINYRLGSFGFFMANIEEADGNMGMYDQVMAIQWVKDNARYFEADPDNVILMGTSAGAISISAHIISPLSQNLFRRAIILSGTTFSPMWMDGNQKLLESSERVASIVGCTNETVTLRSDPRSVVECLKKRPMEVLLEAHTRFLKTSPVTFYPRVGDLFLPEDAVSVYREGRFSRDIDVLFGSDKDEGSLLLLVAGLSDYVGRYGNASSGLSKRLATSLMRLMGSTVKMENLPEKMGYYFEKVKSLTTSDRYLRAMSDLVGDFIISCSSVFLADFLSLKGNRVYYYKFGFRTSSSPMADWVGVMHGEDTQYAFGHSFMGNFTAEEVDLSNRIKARLSAFAYTGNPDVPGQLPWPQYSYNDPLYLNIGQDGESIRLKPWDRCEFWRKDFNSEIDFDSSSRVPRSGMNSTYANYSFVAILILILTILFAT